jgi:hypothetical protein
VNAASRLAGPAVKEGIKLGISVIACYATLGALTAAGAGIGYGVYQGAIMAARPIKRLAFSVGNPVERFIDRSVQARIETLLHNGELDTVFGQPRPQKSRQPEPEPVV